MVITQNQRHLDDICVVESSIFARHGAVRRAFRNWATYCRELAANNNAHITTKGTYRANKEKPYKGTYPKFSTNFYRLRRAFKIARDVAHNSPVPPTPVRSRALEGEPISPVSNALAMPGSFGLDSFPQYGTPGRGREAQTQNQLRQLMGAAAAEFGAVNGRVRELADETQRGLARMQTEQADFRRESEERSRRIDVSVAMLTLRPRY